MEIILLVIITAIGIVSFEVGLFIGYNNGIADAIRTVRKEVGNKP